MSGRVRTNNWQQNYAYDAYGNRALLAGGYGTTGNTQPQVSTITASAVAGIFANNRWSGAVEDTAGNLTTLYAGGPQGTYDAENRAASMTESMMPAISYLYDGEGRRVLKTVGSTSTEYVYGPAGELVAEYGGNAPASGTLYLTADHLGTTRMVTDASGTVTELRDYAPFGEEISGGVGPRQVSTLYAGPVYPSITADANNINFTGKERDAESGLDFFGARYMSSAQGRFTCFFVIEHGRRRILHFNVTRHPTADWIIQQLREALPDAPPYRYAVFDRDSKFSADVINFVRSAGLKSKRSSVRSPWQNGTAERWIGSCRPEMLDHVIAPDERHLLRLLRDYVSYYHHDRIHDAFKKDTPTGRPAQERPEAKASVISTARLGGLHHRYDWRAAA